MSKLKIAVLCFIVIGLVSCTSSGGSSDDSEISSTDATNINNAMLTAMNGVNADWAAQMSASESSPAKTYTSRTIALNGTVNCPDGGHVTYTGNVHVTASENDASIQSQIVFQVSDPTNNLNDCEVGNGVILDGTLTFDISGTALTGVAASLNGTIEINNRGSGGGLVPIGSCYILVSVPRGGTRATGTVCGYSVS